MNGDANGNTHRPAGAPDGGQFERKTNSAPNENLDADDQSAQARPWTPLTYRIPTANLGELQERIQRANHKLERAGITERFTFTATRRAVTHPVTGLEYTTNDVTVNTPRIAIGDWRFDGVHELAANGQVISHFAHGAEPLVDHTQDMLLCDHCGHRRSRTKVVIVTNPSTGERKQVGTNCLELFLGVKPSGLWVLTETLDADDLAVDDDDLDSFCASGTTSITDADSILAVAIGVIAEDGAYLSKTKAGWNETPTSEKVLGKLEAHAAVHPQLTAAERAEIDEVLAWVDKMNPAEVSEYESNLARVLAKDRDGNRRVARKHVPLVVSAIATYRHHKGFEERRRIEQEAREARAAGKRQEYLAEPGASLKGRAIEATIIGVHLGHDYGYGAPLHVTMMDDAGHVIYWKCTGVLGRDIKTPDGDSRYWSPDEGARVRLDGGTVKANRVNDYNGDWETVITRARISPADEEERAAQARA